MEDGIKRMDDSISRQMNTGSPGDHLIFLKNITTPETLEHSQNVTQVIIELADIYSLDPTRARIAGLLHDVAKNLDSKELRHNSIYY